MDPPPQKPELNLTGMLWLLVLGYAFLDFLIPGILEASDPDNGGWVFVALLTGAACGQAGFLIVWAALGPFRLWVRWSAVLATGFGLYFTFCIGMAASVPRFVIRDAFTQAALGSLLLPLLFLSAQLPLWIRKTLGGWQIVPAGEVSRHSAVEARQFGLRHILGLTAALAVALSLAQLAMQNMGSPGRQGGRMAPEMWLNMGLMCVVVCLYSAVWTLMSAWACFLARDKGTGCLVVVGVWLGVSMLLIVIIGSFAGGSFPGEAMAAIFLHFAGTAAVLLGSLHLLRIAGCVMIRTGRKAKPEPAVADRQEQSGSST